MARMPPTKKRKTARKPVATSKTIKTRRTAGKRGVGATRKGLVMDVVNTVEKTLEEIPKQIGKTAKKTKKVASRNRVVAKVVHALEEVPKKIRKAAKKRGRRV